jgi:hypothetical protein
LQSILSQNRALKRTIKHLLQEFIHQLE